MTEQIMTIRQMCEAYDVTPRALRFYEAKELLFPIRQGTRRLYRKADRARLALILKGKRFGFSLEEIRQLLDMWDGGRGREAQLARAIELGEAHLARMRAERARLEAAIAELEAELARGRAELKQEDRKADAA
ncbi:transcriptional regulator, MerR family [Rubellimicrobium thermophilum DSM 16684]|uniref:Transcriptional regulator, MerR family n=1 Tax=Rubellimicrobium thermophilum DSM 16684 TaxID=1123069 RepID=S9R5Z5_9RHOB|nr:MerR family DNA-binding transcriptional regulator [Rubellimicrobium thermophilum]EPX87418.1 transcriptional regulator, MerR family [Rubellimicrobium thermophilum DSM 16684]